MTSYLIEPMVKHLFCFVNIITKSVNLVAFFYNFDEKRVGLSFIINDIFPIPQKKLICFLEKTDLNLDLDQSRR
ncbi:Uncharacterised protein [Enterococcus gallinarum]|uniref:Uncharacterized protein n=1 Tax=Enterococcus gallinarum TaxID=1353 RepID=A0A376GUJ0_ENTGA|nr:hypothetical protein RV03_GL000833 [Enterococcus gallinarum]STD73149.1 Uncharacterised protein [Enterococcus gallinarum]STD82221.1 Uncharacterised protein [Enterococcus gallinarum]